MRGLINSKTFSNICNGKGVAKALRYATQAVGL
jgi:hypothetical protein